MSFPLILAIDDDEVNLNIIEETFAGERVQMHYASSGEGALELLESEGFLADVVILDRMMPGVDGMAVLARIKQSPRLAHTPVVMQTAAAAVEEVEQGLRSGAYYYLTKPYSPEALRTIVRAALEDGRMRRQLSERSKEQLYALRFANAASFVFRTVDEAAELGALLGALCPNSAAAALGLTEILLNAVEHGNLAISYPEKSALQRQNGWRAEIERRAALPEYRDRRVHVTFERNGDALRFLVRDEGSGFDWRRYLDFDAVRAFDPNGRGIAMARAVAFNTLYYEANGSVAIASIEGSGR